MEQAGGDRFAGGAMRTGTGGKETGGSVAAVFGDQVFKQVTEFWDGSEFLVMDGCWGVIDCVRDEVQGVDDAVTLALWAG